MKNVTLKDYKQEFCDEIYCTPISISDLDKCKIPKDILAAEVYLRKCLGDDFYEKKILTQESQGEKCIEKLTEDEIGFDEQVRQLCETIADVDFDTNMDLFLSKISEE